tara:strand:+ start:395 stop:685 length:291 start_codon:yes stop_codon:yes gene_type:complete
MGATNIHYEHPAQNKSGEISANEAFNNLVEQDQYDYGHDPYSGTIATCSLVGKVIKPKDEDEYDKLLDRVDKREVVCYKDGPEGRKNWIFIGWAAC